MKSILILCLAFAAVADRISWYGIPSKESKITFQGEKEIAPIICWNKKPRVNYLKDWRLYLDAPFMMTKKLKVDKFISFADFEKKLALQELGVQDVYGDIDRDAMLKRDKDDTPLCWVAETKLPKVHGKYFKLKFKRRWAWKWVPGHRDYNSSPYFPIEKADPNAPAATEKGWNKFKLSCNEAYGKCHDGINKSNDKCAQGYHQCMKAIEKSCQETKKSCTNMGQNCADFWKKCTTKNSASGTVSSNAESAAAERDAIETKLREALAEREALVAEKEQLLAEHGQLKSQHEQLSSQMAHYQQGRSGELEAVTGNNFYETGAKPDFGFEQPTGLDGTDGGELDASKLIGTAGDATYEGPAEVSGVPASPGSIEDDGEAAEDATYYGPVEENGTPAGLINDDDMGAEFDAPPAADAPKGRVSQIVADLENGGFPAERYEYVPAPRQPHAYAQYAPYSHERGQSVPQGEPYVQGTSK